MASELLKDGPKIFDSFIFLCGNSLGSEHVLVNCVACFSPLETD